MIALICVVIGVGCAMLNVPPYIFYPIVISIGIPCLILGTFGWRD